MKKNKQTYNDELLILFTRFPEPGQVKTRLIPALGSQKAAKLQRILTAESIRQASQLAAGRGTAVEVFYCGGDRSGMERMFKTSFSFRQQVGETLGQRLARAFKEGFDRGMSRIVIIGTDCPQLDAEIMESGLRGLDRSDIVIGPAPDGGFYLIGMRCPDETIFSGIDWGSEFAFSQLVSNVEQRSLSLETMGYLADIDEPGDLAALPLWLEGRLD